MIFSSIVFLLYFLPLLLLLYILIKDSYKNAFLLIASILFYSWGAPKFIFVILVTTVLDFYLVRWMFAQVKERSRKIVLVLSVSMNVGLLFYFKYCNFFIENINYFLAKFGLDSISALNIVLPIGISFYTFESLTYVIDVYRKKHAPLVSFLDYQLYIILFPKLIAGPIIRYHEIADQIRGRFSEYNSEIILSGFKRFVIGLSKKVIIANTVAIAADSIWSLDINQIGTKEAWMGMLAYTFQIYFDFSGYSDMAIGIGQMLGFKFPENFDNPYTSLNITEFWRRWHITLGSWMKNYLYIPLGGNKVDSKLRLFFNLWIVFLLSGFWHGAAWTFIAWGAYHGCWLIIERIGWQKILERIGLFSFTLTFLFVAIGWVLFRSESIGYALRFVKRLFVYKATEAHTTFDANFWTVFILSFVFSFFVLIPKFKEVHNSVYYGMKSVKLTFFSTTLAFVFFIVCVSYITSGNFNPFIYFRF
ncbi:MAG: MBOAT family protein [Bacteroidia bacterium]|nr:MBOAT family protein [Bacteroidia bacterium]